MPSVEDFCQGYSPVEKEYTQEDASYLSIVKTNIIGHRINYIPSKKDLQIFYSSDKIKSNEART